MNQTSTDDYFKERKNKDFASMTRAALDEEIVYVEETLDFDKSLNGAGLDPILRGIVEGDLQRLNAEKTRRNGTKAEGNGEEKARQYEATLLDAENLTDLGNAARIARLFGEDIKFSTALGWLVWDGKRFRRDDTQEIERVARQSVRTIYQEAADADDKDRREALAEWARKSESEQRIGAMVRLCESEPNVAVTADRFDRDPFLFNCANGTLDLRTGTLRERRREDFITKISPVAYEPDAPCVRFEKFLERIFDGDLDLATYIQKIAGYAMTGDTREQEFYIFYGLGANGKTTLVNVLLRVLGDYGMQSPVETLMVKRNGGGIPNDVARLAGARMVAAVESEANQRLAESLVKSLTGGERIAARFLHKEYFEYEPAFKLILSTNHKPRITGTDNAIWRRIRLVPFNVIIPNGEQDKELPTKLKAELPGVLRWAVQGCLLWQREGLEPPAAVTGASSSYREESDTLGEFIEACCEIRADAVAVASELYKVYASWSEGNKERERDRLNRVTFGRALAERGFAAARNKSKGRLWQGVRLKEEG